MPSAASRNQQNANGKLQINSKFKSIKWKNLLFLDFFWTLNIELFL